MCGIYYEMVFIDGTNCAYRMIFVQYYAYNVPSNTFIFNRRGETGRTELIN